MITGKRDKGLGIAKAVECVTNKEAGIINILDLNEDGLITRLDIFWKSPPRPLPEWITPEAILTD